MKVSWTLIEPQNLFTLRQAQGFHSGWNIEPRSCVSHSIYVHPDCRKSLSRWGVVGAQLLGELHSTQQNANHVTWFPRLPCLKSIGVRLPTFRPADLRSCQQLVAPVSCPLMPKWTDWGVLLEFWPVSWHAQAFTTCTKPQKLCSLYIIVSSRMQLILKYTVWNVEVSRTHANIKTPCK